MSTGTNDTDPGPRARGAGGDPLWGVSQMLDRLFTRSDRIEATARENAGVLRDQGAVLNRHTEILDQHSVLLRQLVHASAPAWAWPLLGATGVSVMAALAYLVGHALGSW